MGSPFYLGGGTALSRFFFNHRYSDDLDFFLLPDVDFVTCVHELQGQLEDHGYHVSTFGFSPDFARFAITEPNRFPQMPLKLDFIRPRANAHVGDFIATPLFPRIDNPKNILAEKLVYIHKKFPKDMADIWVICQNLAFDWEDIITATARKATTDPLFLAEIVAQFDAHELNTVLWIRPFHVAEFERDRQLIIKNIITKESNQLFSA